MSTVSDTAMSRVVQALQRAEAGEWFQDVSDIRRMLESHNYNSSDVGEAELSDLIRIWSARLVGAPPDSHGARKMARYVDAMERLSGTHSRVLRYGWSGHSAIVHVVTDLDTSVVLSVLILERRSVR